MTNDNLNLKEKVKKLFYGKDLEDYVTNSIFDEWCRFNFVDTTMKEHIEKDKLYKVWFEYFDSSDPQNSSCKYVIYHIEEVPQEIFYAQKEIERLEELKQILIDYLKE